MGRQVQFDLRVQGKSKTYEGHFGKYLLEGEGSITEQDGAQDKIIEGMFFRGTYLDFTYPHTLSYMVAGKILKKIVWGEISESGSIPGHLYEYDNQGNLLHEEALVDDENTCIIDYCGRMRLQNILKDLPKISEENEEESLERKAGGGFKTWF